MKARILLLNKPYEVLCKFTDRTGRKTLADFIPEPGFYPAGRLDYKSEGLVLLTNSGALQHRISDPKFKLRKIYWVQVEGVPDVTARRSLAAGVLLKDGWTQPAAVEPIPPPMIWPRDPPVRFRKKLPTAWLSLKIFEGRNRQVRRMTAEVGFPTLRLIRVGIGPWNLDDLQPGEWREAQADLALAG